MTLEEAREQLLHLIEQELCRIPVGNPDVPIKMQEFYDYVASLPIDHILFNWYLKNNGEILIEYRDGEVRVIKIDNHEPEQLYNEISIPNINDDLINQVFDNMN